MFKAEWERIMAGLDKSAIKKTVIIFRLRLLILIKWLIIGTVIGVIVGAVSTAFSFCLSYVTELRETYPLIVLGLPVGGIAILGLYKLIIKDTEYSTNEVFISIWSKSDVPAKISPLIFLGTVITHLFGGSAGREGAALQLGASLGCLTGRIFKVKEKDLKIFLTCGMSAAFAALFGTPMAAAVFSIEASTVGSMYIASLLPCVISAVVASSFSASMGISPESFSIPYIPEFGVINGIKIIILAAIVGVLSIVFCMSIKYTKKYFAKWISNPFLRISVASVIFLIITFLIGNGDYYGAGIHVIEKAVMEQDADVYAFILKIILTSIIMGVGFKGGEIVPAFFVGATFGCVAGKLLNLSPGLCAAMGMTAMFCGITNCPITSMLISFELFGFECVPYIIITVAVSFIASGYSGIYSAQRFTYSKYRPEFKEQNN